MQCLKLLGSYNIIYCLHALLVYLSVPVCQNTGTMPGQLVCASAGYMWCGGIPISCFIIHVPDAGRPALGYSDDIAILSWTLSQYCDQKKSTIRALVDTLI